MGLRIGASAHAGPFWASASHAVKRRHHQGSSTAAAAWSWLVLAVVLVTVIHAAWGMYLAAGLVIVASWTSQSRRHTRGSHRR
jgi:hypothetical protein